MCHTHTTVAKPILSVENLAIHPRKRSASEGEGHARSWLAGTHHQTSSAREGEGRSRSGHVRSCPRAFHVRNGGYSCWRCWTRVHGRSEATRRRPCGGGGGAGAGGGGGGCDNPDADCGGLESRSFCCGDPRYLGAGGLECRRAGGPVGGLERHGESLERHGSGRECHAGGLWRPGGGRGRQGGGRERPGGGLGHRRGAGGHCCPPDLRGDHASPSSCPHSSSSCEGNSYRLRPVSRTWDTL